MFGKKNTKPEVTIPGAEGWVEEWDRPENKGIPYFVAYYPPKSLGIDKRAKVEKFQPPQLRAGLIAVPAARVCPNADRAAPSDDTKAFCDFPGWDYRTNLTPPPETTCPGKRWDGKPCNEDLILKSIREYVRPVNHVIKADKEWVEKLCLEKGFPKLDDPADDYYVIDKERTVPLYPFRHQSWRQALNEGILPRMRQPGRYKKPGEPGHSAWGTQKRQDLMTDADRIKKSKTGARRERVVRVIEQ